MIFFYSLQTLIFEPSLFSYFPVKFDGAGVGAGVGAGSGADEPPPPPHALRRKAPSIINMVFF